MIREVDLVSYLPPYLPEYKEMAVTLEAENPEFILVWNAANKVLKNMFIETADEYGISRFEKMLNILPSVEDTIESRRSRVQARWFNMIPYTLKAFIAKLAAVCGDSDFVITKDYLYYTIQIDTNLELFGQVEELERMITGTVPCNMVIKLQNKIQCSASGRLCVAGGVCYVEEFLITNDFHEVMTIHNNTKLVIGIAASEMISINK